MVVICMAEKSHNKEKPTFCNDCGSKMVPRECACTWIELQNRNLKLKIGAHFELSLRHSKALKFHYITMVALVYFDTMHKVLALLKVKCKIH